YPLSLHDALPICLLSEQRGEPLVSRGQPMSLYVGMVSKLDLWLTRVKHVVRISTMHDVDVMAGIPKYVSQAIDIHSIAAKTIRWIKRREVEEFQWPAHCRTTFCMILII